MRRQPPHIPLTGFGKPFGMGQLCKLKHIKEELWKVFVGISVSGSAPGGAIARQV